MHLWQAGLENSQSLSPAWEHGPRRFGCWCSYTLVWIKWVMDGGTPLNSWFHIHVLNNVDPTSTDNELSKTASLSVIRVFSYGGIFPNLTLKCMQLHGRTSFLHRDNKFMQCVCSNVFRMGQVILPLVEKFDLLQVVQLTRTTIGWSGSCSMCNFPVSWC